MTRVKNHLLVALSFAVLAGIGVLMNVDASHAQAERAAPVTVVNTNANPVPVAGNATGSGTVAATQSGAWNVGVNGTPNVAVPGGVSINGTPNVSLTGTPSVNIANAINSPVPVRDISAAAQPFQQQVDLTIPLFSTGTGAVLPDTPPAGKRLVIKYASATCSNVPQGHSISVRFGTIVAGTLVLHELAVATVPGDLSLARIGQQVRWYADPGTQVAGLVDRSFTDRATGCTLKISGFLVDQ